MTNQKKILYVHVFPDKDAGSRRHVKAKVNWLSSGGLYVRLWTES